jgi:uncharacterized membrane protein
MAEILKTIEIDAPVDVVFDYVANPHNALTYMAQFTKFDPKGEPERGLGAKVEASGTFMGVTYKTELEITEYEENARLVSSSTDGVKSCSIWSFKPNEKGGTDVTFSSEYTLPGKKLGLLLDKMIMRKDIEQNIVQTLVNLKKVIEGKPNLRVVGYAQW